MFFCNDKKWLQRKSYPTNVALTYILGQNIHGQESCLYNMNMNDIYTWTDQKKKINDKINYKLMQVAKSLLPMNFHCWMGR